MIISRNNRFSMGRYRSLLIAAVVLCGASAAWGATADGEWTKSTWTTLTASPDAISRPKYIAADRPYTDFMFCDGYANTSGAGNLGNGRVLAWEFPRKATLTGVKLYSNHKDTGRDDIRLASVQVKYTADGEWVASPPCRSSTRPTVHGRRSRTPR